MYFRDSPVISLNSGTVTSPRFARNATSFSWIPRSAAPSKSSSFTRTISPARARPSTTFSTARGSVETAFDRLEEFGAARRGVARRAEELRDLAGQRAPQFHRFRLAGREEVGLSLAGDGSVPLQGEGEESRIGGDGEQGGDLFPREPIPFGVAIVQLRQGLGAEG